MASENTKLAVVVGILSGIGTGLFVSWAYGYWEKRPNLVVSGAIDVQRDRTLIPLRTTSSIPVIVTKIHFRICPDAVCCAAIGEEESVEFDSTEMFADQWYEYDFDDFQVKSDDVTKLPIKLTDQVAEDETLDVIIFYGDSSEYELLVHGVQVNLNRTAK